MSIPVSTVPAVKTYLFEQLAAAVTGDGSHTYGVFYGPAGQNQPMDYLSIGDVTDRVVTQFAMVGDGETGAFRENYSVTVTIDLFHGNEKGATLEAAALAYASQVETIVRADMSLGGLVLRAEPERSEASLTWDDAFNGLHSTVTLLIGVLATL